MSPARPVRRAPARLLLVRGPQLLLAAVAGVLIWRTPQFSSAGNLASIANLASIVGVLAVGQSFALIAGGFDLAQGATLGLAAAVAAKGVTLWGWSPLEAGAAGLGVGLAVGLCSGLAVAAIRTNPFVTTLGATLVVRGITFLLLAGEQIGGVAAFEPLAATLPGEWAGWIDRLPVLNRFPVLGRLLGQLSGMALLWASAVGLAWFVLRQTVFGQHAYATGGNAAAARLAGVRTGRVTVACFALSGLAAGLAGLMWLAFLGVAKADSGQGYELESIAACVLGGVSLQGGRGGVLGAAAGCLLLQALGNLINLARLPDEYTKLVTGVVILLFAAADALARRDERR